MKTNPKSPAFSAGKQIPNPKITFGANNNLKSQISNLKITTLLISVLLVYCPCLNAADIYLGLSARGQRADFGFAGIAPGNGTPDESKLCGQTGEVLLADMLFSRYFNIMEGGPVFTGKPEELQEWTNKGADILVSGSLKINNDQVSLTGQLFDIASRQPIWSKTFTGNIKAYRSLAHQMNDEIIRHYIGEMGIAHTKIVFVNNATGHKELYMADYDGYNLKRLTKYNSICLLPKWSPKGSEIIFTTYHYGNPDLYAITPDGIDAWAVSNAQGVNIAGSYSPDGSNIALTISRGEQPNLYLIDRAGKMLKRLSKGNTIETSPSFAPNGKEIVFISDRAGYPQLYIMNIEGGNIRRITTNGFCDSPAWSPRGDKIVFTMRAGREHYDLYIYDLPSGSLSRLTQDEKNNENPTWSPDGRFIVFSSGRSGKNELYSIAVDGSGIRKVGDIQGMSYTPSWGP